MKHEWRKKEKQYYIPKTKPEIIDVGKFKFIQIDGEGSPNNDEFKKRIEVLYSLSYTIKMMHKNGENIDGYFEYVVYPLEGIWDLTEEGRAKDILDKDELIYTIMIRQPGFVTNEIFKKAMDIVKKKRPNTLLDKVKFDDICEGMSVQMMHIGSFDTENETFDVMKEYCQENNLEIISLAHREIYLSDFRRVSEDKLKTVLRYRVRKNENNNC